MSSNNGMVRAKNYWVWTKLAEAKDPAHAKSGEPVWQDKLYEAPQWMLDQGLIQDASEGGSEGQLDLFNII